MEKEVGHEIVEKILNVISEHDCSFTEAKDVLMNTISVLGSQKIRF